MKRKGWLFVFAYLVLIYATVSVPAQQRPAIDIDYFRHLKLWRAQKSIATAIEQIEEAEKEVRPRTFGDHAERARALLNEAAKELKSAAAQAEKH